MKLVRRIGKGLLLSSAFGALLLGALTLSAPRAEAMPPFRLLCGPSYLWVCTGPSGPKVLFGGTICERLLFEQQTGLTCVPYGG